MNYPDIPPDTLYVNATVDENMRPQVMWAFQGHQGVISLSEARSQAQAIFTAAAIAESEAAIIEGMAAIDKPKGFGKRPDAEMSVQLLRLIRQFRPTLPEGLEVIYGAKTQQPLVVLHWYGEKFMDSPETVRHHALSLLLVAEGAESDGFFYHFMQQKIGVEPHEAYPMIQDFQTFRQRNQLEDLFSEGGDR